MSNKRRHTELVGVDEILRVSAQSGTIRDRWGNALTLTDMDTFKYGNIRAMEFNETGISKINCGTPDTLLGDITIVTWIFSRENSFTGFDRILVNETGIYLYYERGAGRIRFTSDASTIIDFGANSIVHNEWRMLAVRREADGTANLYINLELSGGADQDSGTPVAGGNIIIGNRAALNQGFSGLIEPMIIFDGLLTVQQLSQIHSYTKKWYQQ